MNLPMASLAITAPPTEKVERIAGSSHHQGSESKNATRPVSLSRISCLFYPPRRRLGQKAEPR